MLFRSTSTKYINVHAKANRKIPSRLFSDLSVSINDIFGGGQGQKSHGASGMKLLGADADLCPKAELKAVGEPGGGVHIDRRRIHLVQEPLGVFIRMTGRCRPISLNTCPVT